MDIDDDDLVDKVKHAIGSDQPAKKGKKGLTIFGVAPKELTNAKIRRTDENGKPKSAPSVEILALGAQTVIPPSIHPDTDQPYEWVGQDILQSDSLPSITFGTVDEIRAICTDKDEHFEALNTMHWAGVDGGGNTHDTCVSAVAFMVARDWRDLDIHSRVSRAKRLAVERTGEEYNWPEEEQVVQGWIDSAREKGMTGNAKSKKKPPAERIMADWAIEYLGGQENVACVRGQLRTYRDGHWPLVNIPDLKRRMYDADEFLRLRDVDNAVSIIHTMRENISFGSTPGVAAKDDPKKRRICCLNGTIDVVSGDLLKWDSSHELTHQLDVEWDENAKCPLYDKIVKETFDGDTEAITFWDEYCAHTLVDDMSFQRLLFLRGPGGNGKGTVSRVLRSMHNPECVGSVGVTDLNNERKRTSLVGKLVNISGEQSRLNLVSDTYLKKITGGDAIDIRRLYGETQNNVTLSVRFLELVNDMPATSDNSDALRRRIIILNCPNKVEKPDLDLDAKLHSERAGILNRWVHSLRTLYERGNFITPEQSNQSVAEYMLENDPVGRWIVTRTENVDIEEGSPSPELYADFAEWSRVSGYQKPFTDVYWGKKLTSAGYPAKNKRKGRVVVRLRGLKLKEGLM